MANNVLTIPYSDDLLLSLKKSPHEFEAEARLLLAVKLYEMDRVSTGVAAQLPGMSRVELLTLTGTLGVMLRAKERGLVSTVAPLIDQLRPGQRSVQHLS
jgi:predicted nucleic acid-binding protein